MASLDGVLIKKAHRQEKFTEDCINEFAKCLDPNRGYLHFVKNYFYIQHPVRGKMKFEPFEYQERLMASYHDHRFNINMMPRQSGKALSLDTKIPTPTGWTTMGDIKVGDTILSANGTPTIVTFATEIMEDHTCYKVEFDNGEVIIADAEHLWEINTGFWRKKNKVITTEDIFNYKNSRNTAMYIDITNPVIGNTENLPIPPYTFGVWLGAGASAGGTYTRLIDDNIEIVEYIKEDGFELSPPGFNSEICTIYNLQGLLVSAGVFENKHIPNIYLRSSINQRLELLRGLMDTDGSVSEEGHCEFYQKKYHIIEQVRELLSSLGIKSQVSVKVINDQKYYTITFSTTKYTVFKLSRNANRQLKCKGHPKNNRIYIKDITKTDSVLVRCIQVDNPRHLFLCGNTMIPTHNTTCAAGYLLWYAMFHPDQTILIAAHKYTGAQEIMQRIRYAYEDCPDFIRAGVISYNKGSIEFDNGSRIVSSTTTGNTGRGMSISLLYCDEFAFLQPNIAEEFWTSISPTLATGGRAIITSTPNSDEDTFATIWKEAEKKFDEYGNESPVGVNGFHSFLAEWHEHPDRDEEWKKTELGRIGEERFRREYGCEFLVYDETLINSLTLAGLEGKDPIMRMGQVRWYKRPSDEMLYVVALDPALGTGGNNAAIQVFEMPTMIQVAEWCHNLTPIEGQIKILRDINRYLADSCSKMNGRNIYWSVENNALGEAALIAIKNVGEENIPGLFVSEPIRKGHVRKFRKGFNTTHKTKIAACARLKHMIESKKMTINSKVLITELKAFIAAGITFKAKLGETDDLVLSSLLVMRVNAVLADWDQRVFDIMTSTDEEDLEDFDPPMPIFVSTGL